MPVNREWKVIWYGKHLSDIDILSLFCLSFLEEASQSHAHPNSHTSPHWVQWLKPASTQASHHNHHFCRHAKKSQRIGFWLHCERSPTLLHRGKKHFSQLGWRTKWGIEPCLQENNYVTNGGPGPFIVECGLWSFSPLFLVIKWSRNG